MHVVDACTEFTAWFRVVSQDEPAAGTVTARVEAV